MSDEELKKLATEMKNVVPSDAARKSGMEAAMAAFDDEFAQEQTVAASEKISTPAQGSTAEVRLTGQSTSNGGVQTFRSGMMSKLSHMFSLNSKAPMFMASSAAALMVALIIIPNSSEIAVDGKPSEGYSSEATEIQSEVADAKSKDEITITANKRVDSETASSATITAIPGKPQPVDGLVAATETDDEIVVGGSRIKKSDLDSNAPTQIETQTAPASPKNSEQPQSISGLLTDIRGNTAEVPDGATREQMFESQRESLDKRRAELLAETRPRQAVEAPPPPQSHIQNLADMVVPLEGAMSNVRGQNSLQNSPQNSQRPVPNPDEYKAVERRVLKTPARTIEKNAPAVTKTETRRVQDADGTFRTITETIVVREESSELVTVPPTYETVTEYVYIGNDKFEDFEPNPVTAVKSEPVSTFSIDVDTASYSFLRSSINRGHIPQPSAIRLEEMINYFPYDYEAPDSADEPFKANVTVTETPWNPDTKLMHVGIKGYVPTAAEKPRSNIVFLIDTSGSMNQANKLPLLINSFKLLLNTLDEDDTVSIVTYAGSAGTVLEPTAASDKHKINAALNRLSAGGSTAGAAGLELAYLKAQESFDEDGVNRVILATDGDFNVGFSSSDEMKIFIEKKRETGIFLSVLGFGNGNYNDELMQSLAQNGNGIAAYIDTLAEANKVLADEAGSALITIAKDVKIQVEFNPDTIAEYRLIGYETRALNREDFNNDKVDAGEIGAGHSVTAIYELTPVGSPAQLVDDLRYVSEDRATSGSDELAFVKIRHKLPNADKSTLQTFPVRPADERNMRRAGNDARFAIAVAAVGQKLRGDKHMLGFTYDDAIKLALSAKGEDTHGYRAEFIQLVRLVDSMDQ